MKKLFIIALFALVIPSLVFGQYTTDQIPDVGAQVLYYTANSSGNGTTTLCFPELIQTGKVGTQPNYIGYWLAVILDAGGAGGAPQVEFREITGFAPTTGVLTVGTAFTALAAGDKCYLFPSTELQAICGTMGLPAVTATKFTASGGVSGAEGWLFNQNSLDTLAKQLTGAGGIGDWSTLTSTKAGTNGAGIAEAQLYDHVLLDTLTTIKTEYIEQMAEDLRDSLAAGQAAQRRDVARDSVLTLANKTILDTINTNKLEYAEQMQEDLRDSLANFAPKNSRLVLTDLRDSLAVQGAAQRRDVARDSVLVKTNTTLLDSISGALYGDVGLQWGTSAAPANGVALDEAIRKIYDLVAAASGTPNDWDTLLVYVNLVTADSIWTTVGENEVITMPDGAGIECYLAVRDSIGIGGADSISVCIGDGTSTILTKVKKSDWGAGEYITFAPGSVGTYRVENPTIAGWQVVGDGMAGTAMMHFISNGADIGYNVQTATPITTGYIIFKLIYRKLDGAGTPAAGLGGDL